MTIKLLEDRIRSVQLDIDSEHPTPEHAKKAYKFSEEVFDRNKNRDYQFVLWAYGRLFFYNGTLGPELGTSLPKLGLPTDQLLVGAVPKHHVRHMGLRPASQIILDIFREAGIIPQQIKVMNYDQNMVEGKEDVYLHDPKSRFSVVMAFQGKLPYSEVKLTPLKARYVTMPIEGQLPLTGRLNEDGHSANDVGIFSPVFLFGARNEHVAQSVIERFALIADYGYVKKKLTQYKSYFSKGKSEDMSNVDFYSRILGGIEKECMEKGIALRNGRA